jgi:hypothetical protein
MNLKLILIFVKSDSKRPQGFGGGLQTGFGLAPEAGSSGQNPPAGGDWRFSGTGQGAGGSIRNRIDTARSKEQE